VLEEYEKMAGEFNFKIIDAKQPAEKQQKEIRGLVTAMLRGWEGLPNPILSARKYEKKQRLIESNQE
jgi:hypothetical protein